MCVWQWSYIRATKVHLGQFWETDFLDLKVQQKIIEKRYQRNHSRKSLELTV